MTAITIYKILYAASLIACMTSLGYLFLQRPGRFQQAMLKPMAAACIEVMGYWFRINATTPEVMIISRKLIMLGGSFIYFYMFLFIAQYCNVRLAGWLRAVLTGISVLLGILTFTFDKHSLVYASIDFKTTDGILKFVDTSGPFLHLYHAATIGYAAAMLIIAGIYGRRSSMRKNRQALFITGILMIGGLMWLLDLVFSPLFSLLPITITLIVLMLMFLIYRGTLYDVNDTAREEAFNQITSALISVSARGRFQSCNGLAIQMFPELEGLAVNERFDDECFSELLELLDGRKREKFFEGRIYECRLQELKRGAIVYGRIIWLTDVTSQREMLSFMKNYQKELENLVDEKTQHIIAIQNQVMLSMSDIIENRDLSTGGHVKRTSDVVDFLVKAMYEDSYPDLNTASMSVIPHAAPLHDLGKLTIDDAILRKPGRLTDEEFALMKTHAARGAEMVDKVLTGVEDENMLNTARNIAHYHHERWDGKGYPDGLAGSSIPLEARIMAIADVYDALVSKRCYKEPMSFEQADEIMLSSFGTQFDPSLKEYYIKCRPVMEKYYSQA